MSRHNKKESIRPGTPILSRIDWKDVEKTVVREQRNREQYTPAISVFRWWARRPNAVMGAILDAAMDSTGRRDLVISDPFSGGGTVAVESVRRGLPVYAQDLYPWPTNGLAVSLSSVSPEIFAEFSKDLLRALEPLRSAFRRSDGRELTHIIRVRKGKCPTCNRLLYLFPDPQISRMSRGAKEKHALFGCRACGNVFKGRQGTASITCPACGFGPSTSAAKSKQISCPHCDHVGRTMEFCKGVPIWKPVAVQEVVTVNGRPRATVRIPDSDDPLDGTAASVSIPALAERIPDGVETHRLLEAGFHSWGDLYTVRQANVLLSALHWIEEIKAPTVCKDRLALAVIGMAEMPAYLSRWDRKYLKAYEGIANHRYAHTTLVVESNPLAVLGRGTLHRRLSSASKALKWIKNEVRGEIKTTCLKPRAWRIKPETGATIVTGSSIRQRLKDGVVDFVLTDPPYFDDVQYGELARLLHFWLSRYKEIPKFDESCEAVPNRFRGNGADFYTHSISKVFAESKRTLVPRGRLILTFHNKKMHAWKALCQALHKSGFSIRAMAAVRVENDADHTKREGKGLLYDLVLECGRKEENRNSEIIAFHTGSDSSRDLIAIGSAMNKALQGGTPHELPLLYKNGSSRNRVGGM